MKKHAIKRALIDDPFHKNHYINATEIVGIELLKGGNDFSFLIFLRVSVDEDADDNRHYKICMSEDGEAMSNDHRIVKCLMYPDGRSAHVWVRKIR